VWRASIQNALGNSLLGVIVTATLFTAIHTKSSRASVLSLTELWLFAILLGFFFQRWGSLALVIGMHTIRNVNLTFYFRVRGRLGVVSKSPVKE